MFSGKCKAILLSLFIFLCKVTTAANLQFDTRFTTSTIDGKIFDALVFYRAGLTDWLNVDAGVKYAETFRDVSALHLKGELSWPFYDECSLNLRLHHANYLSAGTTLTHVVPYVHLGFFPVSAFGVIVNAGWYERWGKLSRTFPLPIFSSNYREHDFAASFGFEARPNDSLKASLIFSTIEDIEVYNLNNPFFETRVSYKPPEQGWTASVYLRYKVLLGFGRWDDLMAGLGITLPLELFASRK